MPGKVKVRIFAGRNLPVMDKSSETSDAYVEIKLGSTTYKTDVCRKTLNPSWNTEWFKFEVDDLELQDEPLQIRIMDYDTYSANDSIGRVYIDLGPLLLPQNSGSSMNGWIPIYDTMHGIRGEVNVAVKVDLFSDFNRFRQSSCGVQFFCSPGIPQGYRVHAFQGFVEELVINDDPEYQWIDKIRTPRASNEARQTLFSKLSSEVKRKIGLKAVELGGNAVLGYQLQFDMEGESGIVVRGIGTAATISRITQEVVQMSPTPTKEGSRESYQDFPPNARTVTRSKMLVKPPSRLSRPRLSLLSSSRYHHRFRPRSQSATSDEAIFQNLPFLHQSGSLGSWSPTRSSPESMVIVIPTSSSPTNSSAPTSPTAFHQSDFASGDCCSHSPVYSRSLLPEETLASPPKLSHPKATTAVAASLCRRSSDSELNTWLKVDPASSKSGARQSESVDMLEYPFFSITRFPVGFILHLGGVVSANSVKLLGRINNPEPEARDSWWTEVRMEIRSHARALGCNVVLGYSESTSMCDDICVLSASGTAAIICLHHSDSVVDRKDDWSRKTQSENEDCALCHIPYSESSIPFPVNLSRCSVCRKSKVPDVIFATISPPATLPITGKGCLIQARVCRLKKDSKGEANAKEISDSLPFLQYELHRQLLNKVKVKGMNSLFGLSVQVTIGAKTLIAVATATAVFIAALPAPQVPKITWSKNVEDEITLSDVQRQVSEVATKNRDLYQLDSVTNEIEQLSIKDENEDDSEDLVELDLSSGNKDTCVLEMDDSEDLYDIWTLVNDLATPKDFEIVNTEVVPGVDNLVRNLQMFCRVWRSKLPSGNLTCRELSQYMDNTIQSLFFKLRKMVPCALCRLQFMIDLPEDDEFQVTTCGIAVGLGEPLTKQLKSSSSSELIFSMDEEQIKKKTKRKPFYHRVKKECVGVDVTPLSFIPGAPIDKYLGNLNWFFIRESTSVREIGGFGGFVQSFVAEVLAIIRAQVSALGGNALVSYFMNECVLLNNPHKNQGQCLVNVGGDVVQILTPVSLQINQACDITIKPAEPN